MKKKRTLRIAGVFLAVMLLLTFFSRTIYRGMLPQVEVATARSGMLTMTYTATEFQISSDASISVEIPFVLSRALTVSKVFAAPCQAVSMGDALLSFHAADGELLLFEVQKACINATTALTLWQKEYNEKVTELNTALTKATRKSEQEKLQADIDLLGSGIMNGTQGSLLATEEAQCRALVAALQALQNQSWRILSPCDGTIETLNFSAGDAYNGLAALLSICPTGSPYRVACLWKDAPELNLYSYTITATGLNAGELRAVSLRQTEKDTWVVFELADGMQAASATLTATSPYYTTLVPNSALTNDKLYVLKTKTGAWGQAEYYVESATLVLGATDQQYTAVLSGLSPRDAFIVDSNKPLQDGCAVLLAGYD